MGHLSQQASQQSIRQFYRVSGRATGVRDKLLPHLRDRPLQHQEVFVINDVPVVRAEKPARDRRP